DGAAADLPRFAGPGLDAEIGAAILRVIGLEFAADEHVAVGTGAVCPPGELARRSIERDQPAAHAVFATTVAHQHLVPRHERSHRHRLAATNVAQRRAPQLAA